MKSVLDGRVQLKAYVSVREGEAWLFNARISPYSRGNRENHDHSELANCCCIDGIG